LLESAWSVLYRSRYTAETATAASAGATRAAALEVTAASPELSCFCTALSGELVAGPADGWGNDGQGVLDFASAGWGSEGHGVFPDCVDDEPSSSSVEVGAGVADDDDPAIGGSEGHGVFPLPVVDSSKGVLGAGVTSSVELDSSVSSLVGVLGAGVTSPLWSSGELESSVSVVVSLDGVLGAGVTSPLWSSGELKSSVCVVVSLDGVVGSGVASSVVVWVASSVEVVAAGVAWGSDGHGVFAGASSSLVGVDGAGVTSGAGGVGVVGAAVTTGAGVSTDSVAAGVTSGAGVTSVCCTDVSVYESSANVGAGVSAISTPFLVTALFSSVVSALETVAVCCVWSVESVCCTVGIESSEKVAAGVAAGSTPFFVTALFSSLTSAGMTTPTESLSPATVDSLKVKASEFESVAAATAITSASFIGPCIVCMNQQAQSMAMLL